LASLCSEYAVNASGIVSAMESVAVSKRMNKGKALRKIRTVLKNHEKALGVPEASNHERNLDGYTLEGLNTSMNLHDISAALKNYVHNRDSKPEQQADNISILMHGLPGTGKTHFVNYLGHILEKDVILKRSSDIRSKWV